ncbi:hypothetical protein SBA6_500029 [Candidatus Sulfopaludibacter sp. SbA6]|nr:hypothetical protein SBA6_500029 [Candidatus Sulfopaludibacter sp. SbA6]
MLDAAREAVEFGAGSQPEDLVEKRVLALALVRSIEIIGEAASRVSQDLRAAYPEVPWGDILGNAQPADSRVFRGGSGPGLRHLGIRSPPLIVQLERILS